MKYSAKVIYRDGTADTFPIESEKTLWALQERFASQWESGEPLHFLSKEESTCVHPGTLKSLTVKKTAGVPETHDPAPVVWEQHHFTHVAHGGRYRVLLADRKGSNDVKWTPEVVYQDMDIGNVYTTDHQRWSDRFKPIS